MTSELKPCPFCGCEAVLYEAVYNRASCSNESCAGWSTAGARLSAWNTRAPAPAPAVKVKALVWGEPCAANNHIYMARAPWGTYGIHIDGGRHRAWLEAHEKPYERWLGDGDVGSVYEAQGAAEADNEERTRELIYAPAPAPAVDPMSDPRVVTLVEDIRIIANNPFIQDKTRKYLRAALAALDTP